MCGVGGNALGGVHGRGVAVGDVLGDVVGVEYGAAPVGEAFGGDPPGRGVDGVDAPAVAVAHRILRWHCLVFGVPDVDGGALRRVRMRSPAATRCPRVAVTVAASAETVSSSWMRWLRASAISVVSHNSSASLPTATSLR